MADTKSRGNTTRIIADPRGTTVRVANDPRSTSTASPANGSGIGMKASGITSTVGTAKRSGITFEVVGSGGTNGSATRRLQLDNEKAKSKGERDTTTIVLVVVAVAAFAIGVVWSTLPEIKFDSASAGLPAALDGREFVVPELLDAELTFGDVKGYRFRDMPADLVRDLRLGAVTRTQPPGIVIATDPPFWHQRIVKIGETVVAPIRHLGRISKLECTLVYFDDGVAILRDPDGKLHRLLNAGYWEAVAQKYGWHGAVLPEDLAVEYVTVSPIIFEFALRDRALSADPETDEKLARTLNEYVEFLREKLKADPNYLQTPADQEAFFAARGLDIEVSEQAAPYE